MSVKSSLVLGLCAGLLSLAGAAAAQEGPQIVQKKATAGQELELKGAVIKREGEEFQMRMLDRTEYRVLLTDATSIKTERKGAFRAGKVFDITSIIDGLVLEVDGVGDDQGRVVAKKVRFTESDLHAAITTQIHTRPVEASAAAAHERIGALDQWEEKGVVSVYFATNVSTIDDAGKKALDDLAAKAPGATNYRIEITGHTDSTGNDPINVELSEKRAEAVVRYLTVDKKVPLRRVVLPMGYAATAGTHDNATEEGRAKNRRVDVRVLVNVGASTPAPAN